MRNHGYAVENRPFPVNTGCGPDTVARLLADYAETPPTLVHPHTLVHLQFADRRGLGIPGSVCESSRRSTRDIDSKLRSRVGGGGKAGRTQAKQSCARHFESLCSRPRPSPPPDQPYPLLPDVAFPSPASAPRTSPPISLSCRRRLPRTYCVTNHFDPRRRIDASTAYADRAP